MIKFRKIIGYVAAGVAPILLTVMIPFSIVNVENCSDKKEFEGSGLKKQSQIIDDLKLFQDADTSYLLKTKNDKFRRLGNNGKGNKIPIIVKSFFTEDELNEMKQVVDDYNNLMMKIDDKYLYEFYFPDDDIPNSKVKIDLNAKNLGDRVGANASLGGDFKAYLTDGFININTKTTYTEQEAKTQDVRLQIPLKKALRHELLHLVGFDDVYDFDNYNTFLKGEMVFHIEMNDYTPTDVSNLCLLYYNHHRTDDNKQEKIEEIISFLESYRLGYLNRIHESFNYDDLKINDFGSLKIKRKIENCNALEEIVLSGGVYKQIFTDLKTGKQKSFVNVYNKVGETIYLNKCRMINEKFDVSGSCFASITNSKNGYIYGHITNAFYKFNQIETSISETKTDVASYDTQGLLKDVQSQITVMNENINKVENKVSCFLEKINLSDDKKNKTEKKGRGCQLEL